jgi:hypothetical protein
LEIGNVVCTRKGRRVGTWSRTHIAPVFPYQRVTAVIAE